MIHHKKRNLEQQQLQQRDRTREVNRYRRFSSTNHKNAYNSPSNTTHLCISLLQKIK
jgi:hypothetical protein